MRPRIDPDAEGRDAHSELVLLDSLHWFVEYAIPGPRTGAAGLLVFAFVDPGATPETPRSLARAIAPADAAVRVARPPIVSRAQWGCPDGAASPAWPPAYTEVTHLIIHHTLTGNVADDWPALVRSLWAVHTHTRDWGDIGYNYLVDPLGVIYEGRGGGDDVVGAHFSCQNANTMGVALLGDYESVSPTPEAVDALVQLLAWKARRGGIDPLGAAEHPGTQLLLDDISGHRDGNASLTTCSTTTCPGDQLYGLLPAIRTAIAEAVAVPEPVAPELGVTVVGMLGVARRLQKDKRARARS
jgi:hypothetical protein